MGDISSISTDGCKEYFFGGLSNFSSHLNVDSSIPMFATVSVQMPDINLFTILHTEVCSSAVCVVIRVEPLCN